MSAIIFCFCSVVCRDADGQVSVPIKKADVIKRPKAFDHVGLLLTSHLAPAKLLLI